MTVESPFCDCPRCVPADDLVTRLQQAAVAALDDLGPTLERDRRRITSVLFELDLQGGRVTSAHAWVDYRTSVSRLLGKMPPAPGEDR